MKIGFTGTQVGMTRKQKNVFEKCILQIVMLESVEFHHGDCVGSDEQASRIIHKYGMKIVIHPPMDRKKRAFCKYDKIVKEKPYLVRNRDIINDTEILFATPKEEFEVLRSGTWSTIRYALKLNKDVIIIYPSGVVEEKGRYNVGNQTSVGSGS